MVDSWSPSPWRAVENSDSWQVVGEGGTVIAAIPKSDKSEQYARLIAASPYLLKALEMFVYIFNDDDLADNGEFDGFVILDAARTAVKLAGSNVSYQRE